jgi:MFS family permease
VSKAETAQVLSNPLSHWGRLAANSSAHLTEHLFNGVIAVILPLITASLGLTLAQAGMLASARTLMAGVASFPSGFLADLASRRNLLLGICIGMIGLATFGLSAVSSFPLLMILSARYRDKRAFALGVHDSSANLGEVLGPLSIGLLLSIFDWRTTLQIWAIPGLAVGLLYALFGGEGDVTVARRRDYRRALWEDVVKNKTVFALVAVSTLRAMGQTALAVFLPLYLLLHLKLTAAAAGAYMSILFLFAGAAPALVGWLSDRFGHRLLIVVFSMLSVVAITAIPYLASGFALGCGLAALGALLWALRPVIVSAAMEAAPQNLTGSIIAFIYGANMGVSFLAPILAGIVADAYGLPRALAFIALFPFAASVLTLMLLRPAAVSHS